MLSRSTGSPLGDVEFLARSDHRITALAAMAGRPRTRADLLELTGASASTIGRTLREFEERRWVGRDGNQFEATRLGAFVASGMQELVERIETEQTLRDAWQWLPTETDGFTIEMGANAVVTIAEADDPYGPVNRFASLLRETDRYRFVGVNVALLEPCKDELRQRIVGGMETDVINSPGVARHVLSTYGDHCSEPLDSGNLTVRVHDELPSYGVSLFDDRIAISGHDPDGGTVRMLLDTDALEAREWAESTYESYRREARPLDLEPIVA